jgi:hypothetical protein
LNDWDTHTYWQRVIGNTARRHSEPIAH